MATKTIHRRLTEAELNAPDLDDDGNLDVETFPVPGGEGIENPELKSAWEEAMRILDARSDEAPPQRFVADRAPAPVAEHAPPPAALPPPPVVVNVAVPATPVSVTLAREAEPPAAEPGPRKTSWIRRPDGSGWDSIETPESPNGQ